MNKPRLFGVIAGIFTAVILIVAVQMISMQIYPLPDGVSTKDKEAMKAHIAGLPDTAMYLVLLGYVLAAFFGSLVATKVSKEKYIPALIIGVLLTIGAIMNSFNVPQPLWMSLASIIVMIPLAWLGAKLVKLA